MRNLLFALLLLLSACSQPENKRLKGIEQDIKNNAMGMDIGYKPGRLDTVVIVHAKDGIADLSEQLGHDLTKEMDKAIEVYTGVYEQAKTDNDVTVYNLWKSITERLVRLKNSKPGELDYSVYKYTYSVTSGFNPKEHVEVCSYYFYDSRDSLVGHYDCDGLNTAKTAYIKSPLQPYDMVMFSIKRGIPL